MRERQTTPQFRIGWLGLQWLLLSGTNMMAYCESSGLQRLRVIKDSTGEEEETIFKDIWEAEAFLAEREAERLLQGDIFTPGSFPPTPQPTGSPATSAPQTPQPTEDEFACLDGRTRQEYLFDQLSLVSDSADLLNPNTPQGQAFIFMNNDPLDPNVCAYPIEQRYGLVTFYFATEGALWTANTGWVGGLTECNWFGLLCNDGSLVSNMTLRKTVHCSELLSVDCPNRPAASHHYQ
mmetsp:Transcript_6265/g.13954  ORF Transcript_6265/g.13954 Transcript_6265/m.13954 type:complete len:236 (+) Transcript_6265:173-880(+)